MEKKASMDDVELRLQRRKHVQTPDESLERSNSAQFVDASTTESQLKLDSSCISPSSILTISTHNLAKLHVLRGGTRDTQDNSEVEDSSSLQDSMAHDPAVLEAKKLIANFDQLNIGAKPKGKGKGKGMGMGMGKKSKLGQKEAKKFQIRTRYPVKSIMLQQTCVLMQRKESESIDILPDEYSGAGDYEKLWFEKGPSQEELFEEELDLEELDMLQNWNLKDLYESMYSKYYREEYGRRYGKWSKLEHLLRMHEAEEEDTAGNSLLVIGGYAGPFPGYAVYEHCERLTPCDDPWKAKEWKGVPSMLSPRASLGLAYACGKLFALGGIDNDETLPTVKLQNYSFLVHIRTGQVL
eukprot:759688-Hanusia_phi.AAC.8